MLPSIRSAVRTDAPLDGIPTGYQPQRHPFPSRTAVTCSPQDIRKAFPSLSVNNGPSPGVLHTRVLDDCLPYLQLAMQFLQTDTRDWWSSAICSMFKRRNRELASNHCPISLKSVVYKAILWLLKVELVMFIINSEAFRGS